MMATAQMSINFKVHKARSKSSKQLETKQKYADDACSPPKILCRGKLNSARSVDAFEMDPKKFASLVQERNQSGRKMKVFKVEKLNSENVLTPVKASRTNTWAVPGKPKTGKRASQQHDENTPTSSPVSSPQKSIKKETRSLAPVQLFKQDVSVYQELKKAFALTSVAALPCREKEFLTITEFLDAHLLGHKPGSLYISGAPGTGKTICLNRVLQETNFRKFGYTIVSINCMNLRTVNAIYERLWLELNGKKDITKSISSTKKGLTNLMAKHKMILLILDEIDYLENKDQDILYTIFEWPSLERSNLVLIGIANALDLTDRILPRLQVHSTCRPQLLHFPPYSKDEVLTILQDRLQQVSSDSRTIIQSSALQLCARKVSSVSGDVRKALDVCRRAVELAEGDVRQQQILQPHNPNPGTNSSKSSSEVCDAMQHVELGLIAKILNEVYGSSLPCCPDDEAAIPLHQKLLLCTLLVTVKKGRSKEVTLGKGHEIYCRICKKREIPHLDHSDFVSVCSLLETRGLIGIKSNKNSRLSKITLRVDENEAELVMKDRSLLAAILQDSTCLVL